MKKINHGIPSHDYFAIAQPSSVFQPTVDSLEPSYKRPILELEDPYTHEKCKAELYDIWRFTIAEFEGMNAFCRLVYGIDAPTLSKHLRQRYPEIEQTQKISFLLLKKI